MLVPTIIIGLKSDGMMLLPLIPLLAFAFVIAGTLPFLIPQQTIARWVGAESGFRGILIGTLEQAVGGWSFRNTAHGSRNAQVGRQCGNDGSSCDWMVAARIHTTADGNRSDGLAVHAHSPSMHFFLPSHCWPDRQQILLRD